MAGILWTIIAILVAFWLIGLTMEITGGLIHLVLVAAAVLFVIHMFMGRSRV